MFSKQKQTLYIYDETTTEIIWCITEVCQLLMMVIVNANSNL